MSIKFFADCKTVEEIKIRYRELARKHHPDLGGDLETMKMVNDAYDKALKGCHGQTTVKDNGEEYTYSYDPAVETRVREKIEELLGLEMEGVDIWLIGVWVWVEGDTKPHKESLKALGLRWHSKRGCWYYAGRKSYGYRKSGKGLEDIAADYGAKKFAKRSGKKLAG